MFPFVAVVILGLVGGAWGNGYMLDPPARSSMWRAGFNTPKNYNDMSINCGGYNYQNFAEKGKCGVCGDPYGQPQPRDNEAGGLYGRGVIAKHYQQGQDIHIAIVVTANHEGYFEFRLCKNDDVNKIVTQDCLDMNLLELRNADGTRYHLHGTGTGQVDLTAKLPTGLTCSQCVLQWKWHSGNNVGRGKDNIECRGCGPQEEYYGCSDISIGPPVLYGSSVTQAPPVYVSPSTHSPPKRTNVNQGGFVQPPQVTGHGRFDSCHGVGLWGGGLTALDNWCVENCALGNCPSVQCFCPAISGDPQTTSVQTPKAPTTKAPTTKAPTTKAPTTKAPTTKSSTRAPFLNPVITPGPLSTAVPPQFSKCHGVNNWYGVPQLDEWCQKSCSMYYCPQELCLCPY